MMLYVNLLNMVCYTLCHVYVIISICMSSVLCTSCHVMCCHVIFLVSSLQHDVAWHRALELRFIDHYSLWISDLDRRFCQVRGRRREREKGRSGRGRGRGARYYISK